eukprot:9490109-Pyramimonas_sp.AAC.1
MARVRGTRPGQTRPPRKRRDPIWDLTRARTAADIPRKLNRQDVLVKQRRQTGGLAYVEAT